MTTVIQIYGKSFNIGFSDEDNERRKKFFQGDGGSLTAEERSLLLSIGIDTTLENSLKPYLATFFTSLQMCSSDTSLILSRNCETAYFVLWSAMFHNRAQIESRLKKNEGGIIDDLELAEDGAFIEGVRPKYNLISDEVDNDDITKLFTLMILEEDDMNDIPEEDSINKLFTLMALENTNAN